MDYLREFHFLSVCARLLLALLAGGILGYGRAQKKQTAGLRTYIITSVGSALSTLIAFYEYEMLTNNTAWAEDITDPKFDGSRFSAAVLSGIGFLAAGSIMVVAHGQISGLTTAIGLFAAAYLGIAAGAGYYEIVLVALVFIVLTLEVLQPVEVRYKRRARNMTIHVDFSALEDIDRICRTLEAEGAKIFEFELDSTNGKKTNPAAVVEIKLSRKHVPFIHSVLSRGAAVRDERTGTDRLRRNAYVSIFRPLPRARLRHRRAEDDRFVPARRRHRH